MELKGIMNIRNTKTGFFSLAGYDLWDISIAVSTSVAFILMLLVRFSGITIFASHLIFIPIAIFAYRYPEKALIFSGILAVVYLLIFNILFSKAEEDYYRTVLRALAFLCVGGFVGYISGSRKLKKERYPDIFQNIPESVFVCGITPTGLIGKIQDCNKTALRYIGHSKEEIKNLCFYDLFPEKERNKMMNMTDISTSNECLSFESEISGKNGEIYPVEISTQLFGPENSLSAIIIAKDISLRKKAEAEILDSRWKLYEAHKIANLGYWEIDFDTWGQKWSDEAFMIFGMEPTADSRVTCLELQELIDPADAPEALENYYESINKGKDYSQQMRIMKPGGEKGWIKVSCQHYLDDSGKIIRSLGTVRDITNEVNTETKIKEQAEYFGTLLETIPNPVFYKDEKGVYKGCNQAYADMAGFTREEIVGKTVYEIFEKNTAEAQNIKDDLVHRASGTQVYESEIHGTDNRIINVIVSKAAVKDKYGNPAGIVGVIQDITEIKKTKANLFKSLEEKSVLLQEVNHRVKNNLAAISGILEIEKSRIDDEKALEFLTEAENRIQSMVIVHESLYHSGSVSEIDADEHFRNLAESVMSSYSHYIQPSLFVDTNYCKIDIKSAIPCSLVLNEILTNSMKYAFCGRKKGNISIILECSDGKMTLMVSDDGIGIPDDFDPDTSPTLGMKVIYNIVRLQLRGEVTLERTKGTKWIVTWPKNGSTTG